MVELVKKDDSVLAGSLALSAGVALWRQNSNLDLEPLLKVVQVEDLFAQADSFERQLSFDNDVAITYWFIKVCSFRLTTQIRLTFEAGNSSRDIFQQTLCFRPLWMSVNTKITWF